MSEMIRSLKKTCDLKELEVDDRQIEKYKKGSRYITPAAFIVYCDFYYLLFP